MRGAFNNRMSAMASAAEAHDHNHEQTIHSGHFMVSRVHEENDDQLGEEKDLVTNNNNVVQQSNVTRSGFQSFDGSIDSSLAGLFRQMTLAYRGKLVSPKWKNFKGIKVKLKEKIRLNNLIWREWFMQYIQKKKSVVCQFEVPAFEGTHCSPEAIVLEGKYWKRQFQCLTTEYKKWRLFYKEKSRKKEQIPDLEEFLGKLCGPDDGSKMTGEDLIDQIGDQFWTFLESDLQNFHDDTLFHSDIHPFAFPDQKEIMQGGYSRILQPQLLQLQPTIIDQMEIDYAPFPDKNPKTSRCDPLISNQMSYDCDRLAESLEIDKIQRELMNEEIEILGFSSQGHAEFPGMTALNSHNEAYHWQTAPLCGPFDSTQPFVDSNQSFVDSNQSFVGSNQPFVDSTQPFVDSNQSFVDSNQSFVGSNQSFVGSNQSFVGSNQPFDGSFQNPDVMSSDMFASQNVISEPVFHDASQDLAFNGNLSDIFFQDFRQPRDFSENFLIPSDVQFDEPMFQQHPIIAHNNVMQPSSHSASSSALDLDHFGNQCFQNNPQQQHQMVCQSYTFPDPAPQVENPQFMVDNSFCENLEAARRRASTGSVVALRSKKHVSFAVPNMPLRQRSLNPVQRSGESHKIGVLKSSRNFQPSLLEQLLLQGKPVHPPQASRSFQVPPPPPPDHKQCHASRTGSRGRKPKKSSTNINQGNSNNASAERRFSCTAVNFLDAQQESSCLQTQTDMTFGQNNSMELHQAIPQPTANQQLQLFLLSEDSASANSSMLHQASSSSTDLAQVAPTCDPNLNPLNMRFEVTNEFTKQTIKFNTQSFNQVAPTNDSQDNQAFHMHNNQVALFPACIEEGPSVPSFVLEKSVPPPRSRSRHSSNDSSSGHGTSDSLKERKKTYHMSAEHQRRCLIKQGFDTMNDLVPELRALGAGKINKASTLSKGAEYIKQLRMEKDSTKDLIRMCKKEVDHLTNAISELQQKLPASGISAPSQKTDRMSLMMKEYVYERTMDNWKFWIFSIIMRSWMESYNETVLTRSKEDMLKSIMLWLDTKCSLPALREGVLSSLPFLCKVTSILENPSKLPHEAMAAAHHGRPPAL